MKQTFQTYPLLMLSRNSDPNFYGPYFKRPESDVKSRSANTHSGCKHTQCGYLGASSHSLRPSACHMATRYSLAVEFAVWSGIPLEDIPEAGQLSKHTKRTCEQLKCPRVSINSHFKSHNNLQVWAWKCPLLSSALLELWLLSLDHFFKHWILNVAWHFSIFSSLALGLLRGHSKLF